MRTEVKLWSVLWCAVAGIAAEPCDPVKTFADGRKPQGEIFVSPAGNNHSGDGSRAKPFLTMQRALEGIQPGNAVRLLPGKYSGGISIANISGAQDQPIWIGGVPGE